MVTVSLSPFAAATAACTLAVPWTGRVGVRENRSFEEQEQLVGPQALIYFGIAGGSLALAVTLLFSRFVSKDQSAVRSRGGFAFFAGCLILFAIGAAVAGYVSAQAGR